MNQCKDLSPLLAIHAVEETDVGEALRVEEHVGACVSCREELERYRTIRETARRDLREAPPVPDLTMPGRAGLPATARVWAPRLAAAALLLATGLIVGRWSAPAPQAPAAMVPGSLASVSTGGSPALARRSAMALSVFSPAARRFLEKAAKAGIAAGESPRPETAP